MQCGVVVGLLFFCALSTAEEDEVLSTCGEDTLLHCLAETEAGVQYKHVIWYKVNTAPSRKLTGLVMKRLTENNSNIERYKGLNRDVEILGDSQDLLLTNVTLQDAGRYLCFLSAPLGHQNREREIHLSVYGCPKDDARIYAEEILYLMLAVVLLLVALLMYFLSYRCLKDTLNSHSKPARLKATKMKHLIVTLGSKGIVTNVVPQSYV
ncbi:uncharacterized protein [Hoplias malabaricus]|uniref:uncharacterized protein n=1 Tax=Hoplias malabaricus TaxID=27720 RepID=UPI00346377BD